ncbi:MAG: ABC transporter substrate-binding protein [Armatimonadota bacterium]
MRPSLWPLMLAPLLLGGCFQRKRYPPGRTVVTYWEKWTGFEGEAMRDVVDAYNASQDKIYVELLTISQIDRKTVVAAAGGVPPDVAGLWSFNVHAFADKNSLTPLDDYLAEAGIARHQYISCYWDMCEHRGAMWALPTTPASVALHWNKTLFAEAGLDPERPPTTMDELDAFAQRLTKRDSDGRVVQMGFMPAEPGWWNWAWGYFFGGKLWDGQSRITCASPENTRAFEWVQSYAKDYGVKALQLFQSGFGNFSSPQNAFLDGKVAMELQGVWMHNFISREAPDLQWGAAPFPYPSDRPDLENVTIVGEDVLVIPHGARHPQEAFEFIKFVNSQKGMELLCMGQRKHTPLRAVSPEFLAEHENPYIEVFIDLAYSPNAVATPKMSVWDEYRDEMVSAFDQIWLCRGTPRDVLGAVQKRIQEKLDREIQRQRKLGLRIPGT